MWNNPEAPSMTAYKWAVYMQKKLRTPVLKGWYVLESSRQKYHFPKPAVIQWMEARNVGFLLSFQMICFLFFWNFFGAMPRHMEIPGLGIELKPQQ